MDRIAATRRPSGRVVGHQKWRDLLFLHWPVDADELRRLVPDSLDIDTFDGQAYIGLVPFAMLDVRPWWLPRALAFSFLETNLRTYVHVRGRDPGVYFFSLEAASYLAVKAARIGWGLPYFHARMSLSKNGDDHSYQSKRRSKGYAGVSVDYRVTDELGPSTPNSLEFFLFERYLLHVERNGVLSSGQVHHRPYPVFNAQVERCEQDLLQAAGLANMDQQPSLSHFSPGVDVEIFALQAQASAAGA